MGWTQFFGLLKWLGRRSRIDRYILLRIYRAAAKKACQEFGVEWTIIRLIFKNSDLKDTLYHNRHSEEAEKAELTSLVRTLNVVSENKLSEFIEKLSVLALDRMEDSYWWQERARERVPRYWNRYGKAQNISRAQARKFFSTAPAAFPIVDSFLVSRPRKLKVLLSHLLTGSPDRQLGSKVALWGHSGYGKVIPT